MKKIKAVENSGIPLTAIWKASVSLLRNKPIKADGNKKNDRVTTAPIATAEIMAKRSVAATLLCLPRP